MLSKNEFLIIMTFLFVCFIFVTFGLSQEIKIFSQANPEAIQYLEKAVQQMNQALETYEGANYPGKELWSRAIDNAQKAIGIDPDFIEGHYYLALIYQHTNWYFREAEQWQKYLELIESTQLTSPQVQQNLSYAYYRLGYASYQKGDKEQCLIYLLQSVKAYPDLIDANYWTARVFYETGDLENSLFYWERVLALDPFYPKAQYFLDKVKASLKYGKEAYNRYEQGYNEYENKNYGKAIDAYQQAIRLNPEFTDAYYWLGRVYFETGDYRMAIYNYQKVLEIEPDNSKADYWLKEARRQLNTKE